jgi:hypothetical protein
VLFRVGITVSALMTAAVVHAQTPAKPAAKPAPPALVTLNFDWGDDTVANVIATREEIVEMGDSKRVSKLEARFRLHAVRDANGYAITFSDLSMTLDGRPIPATAQPENLGPVSGLVLSYDVDRAGTFFGLRDFEKLQRFTEQNYRAEVERMPPDRRPTPDVAQRVVATGTSREVLQVNAARTWGALVGMWVGIEVQEGDFLMADTPVTIPFLNAPVTLRTSASLVRREECSKADRAMSCVRLRASSTPDTEELAAAVDRLAKSAGAGDLAAGSLEVQYEYEVLTEPGTLRPHHVEWAQVAGFSSTDDGKEKEEGRQSSKMTMTFDYAVAPPATR